MLTLSNYITQIFIAISVIFIFTNCSDEKDPVSPTEHFKPYGFVLESSGRTLLKAFNGLIDPAFSNEIEVPFGGETELIEIIFLDKSGNEITPNDSNLKLSLVVDDTTITNISRHEGEDWEFHLRGLKLGETNFELQVLHIDHPDFRSPKIKVNVKQIGSGVAAGYILKEEEADEELVACKPGGEFKGSITLTNGTTTDHIEISLIDKDLAQVFLAYPLHKPMIEVADKSIIEVIYQFPDEPWAIKFKALKPGLTTMKLKILKEESPFVEFTCSIPVLVN